MLESLDHPPVVFRSKRWRPRQIQIVVVALLVLATNLSALAYEPASKRPLTYAIAAALALLFVLRGASLVLPPSLRLEPSGLTLKVGWRRRHWTWETLTSFRPVRYAGMEVIGFDFITTRKSLTVRQANFGIAGSEAVLPGAYDIAPIELAGLLNHARERWAGQAAIRPPAAAPTTLRARALIYYSALFVGRMDRRTFWATLAVLLAVQLTVIFAFKGDYSTTVWGLMGCYLVSRGRFRDFGWSPWAGVALLVVAVPMGAIIQALAAAIFTLGETYANLVGNLVVFVTMGVIGCIKGDPGANRYGPASGGERQSVESVFS